MFSQDRHDPGNGAAVSSNPAPIITPEQYLEAERRAETKSEYFAGRVYAMAGASLEHTQIITNLLVSLHAQLRGRNCSVLASDLRLRVPATGLYTYPDVIVVCGDPQLEDDHFDTLLNPTILIEVLSDSTERYDRGRKAEHYRTIASLHEYLLVRQDEAHIECYRRHGEAEWLLSEAWGLDQSIELTSIAGSLMLSDVYEPIR
jgi:Uma2 family endonuclease